MAKLKLSKPPEIEISYRYDQPITKYPKVTKPEHIYAILHSIWKKENICHHEELVILIINTACRVLGYHRVGVGGITAVIGDPRIIFQVALKGNAHAIVVAHNHPSGEAKPSKADLMLAKQLKAAGEILGIELLDNVIITQDEFYSYG